MNKKGDGDTYVLTSKWWYYIIVLFIFMVSLVLFLGKGVAFVQSRAPVADFLPTDIAAAKLFNVCLAYEEDGKVLQGILDEKKLTKERLEECGVGHLALTITSIDEDFAPIVIDNSQITASHMIVRYVLLEKEGKRYPAIAEINI